MELEVDLLRTYRDRYLVNKGWGRVLLKAYYTLSPLPADFISERPILRSGARLMLSPIIGTVRSGGHTGALPVAVGFVMVFIPLASGTILIFVVLGTIRKCWFTGLKRKRARYQIEGDC